MNTNDVDRLKLRIKNLEILVAAKQIELDAYAEQMDVLAKTIRNLVSPYIKNGSCESEDYWGT